MAEAVYVAIEYVATVIGTEMTLTFAELYFASEVIVAAAALGAAKQQQVAAERKARQAWARSQSDRYLMSRGTLEPRRVVLGERRVSGPMAYVGSYVVDREHLVFVVAIAAHEVAEIGAVYFDDEEVVLDGSGNVIGINRLETFSIASASDTFTLQGPPKSGTVEAIARYGTTLMTLGTSVSGNDVTVTGAHASDVGRCEIRYQPDPCPYKPTGVFAAQQSTVATGSSQVVALAHTPVSGSVKIVEELGDSGQTEITPTSVVGVNVTFTGTSSATVYISYQWTTGTSLARVRKYLGRMDDAADSAMVAALGGQWTTDHRGAGVAKLVVELDYDREAFSGGIPNVSAAVKGLRCYDHRINDVPNALCSGAALGTPGTLPTGWSRNVSNGLSSEVVGYGTDELTGLPYLSLRIFGTTTAAGTVYITPTPDAVAPAAAPGDTWSCRAQVRRVSGSAWSVWSFPRLQVLRYDSGGTATAESSTTLTSTMVEGKQDWVEVTDAALAAGAVKAGMRLALQYPDATVIDQTVMLLLPQLWEGDVGDATDPGAWSENPALLVDAFATHPLGGRLPWSQIDTDWNGAQATICDTTTTYTVGGVDYVRALYTAGYVAATDQRPVDVLTDLCAAMGGEWVYQDGKLRTKAGAWRAPVLTLDESWLLGDAPVQSQMDLARDDKVNCIRGGFYDAAQNWQSVPFQPIEPAAYIALDKGKLPTDVDYGAITFEGQAGYVSACRLRADRQGEVLQVKCNYRAWEAEPFDVINVTLARFGLVSKAYEVRQDGWTLDGGILLTLRETDSSVFDMDAEFTTADPAPNTRLPDPWSVAPITGLAAASGTTHLLLQQDGTIVTRVSVTWDVVADPRVIEPTGHIEVEWLPTGGSVWQTIRVPGDRAQVYLIGPKDQTYILLRARAVGAVGKSVDCEQVLHFVQGKSAVPADVTGLTDATIYGAIELEWDQSTELDYLETELRKGGTAWASATPLTGTTPTVVRGAKYLWAWPAQGTYTVRARHRDTSGNISAASATTTVIVDDRIKLGSSGIDVDLAGINLVPNSSYERDSDLNGRADNFSAYSNGTVGTITNSQVTGRVSGYAQRLAATSLGATSNDATGYFTDVDIGPGAIQNMIASAWMKTSANVTYRLRINYYIAGVLQGNLNIDANSNGTDWQRVSLPFTSVPSTIDKIRIYQWMHTRTSGTTVWMELDDLQLEEATIPSAWHPYPGDYEPKVWIQSTDPGAAAKEGDEWVNTGDNRIYVRRSGAWVRKETVGDGDIDTPKLDDNAATGTGYIYDADGVTYLYAP